MQLFVRDTSGKTTAFTAASPLELQEQVYDSLHLPASTRSSSQSPRLSYRSRTLNAANATASNSSSLSASSSSPSFADYDIVPYSTIDLSFRLRGGAPKKRCAHVSVKASSSSSANHTPSTSGTATPSSNAAKPAATQAAPTVPATAIATAPAEEGKKEDTSDASAMAVDANATSSVEESEKKADNGTTVTVTPATSAAATATPTPTTTTVGPTSTLPAEPILERCSNAALRMVGECSQCGKNFCGNHRLPEDHACPALQTFRKAAFDENMKRLNKEATFTSKISAF